MLPDSAAHGQNQSATKTQNVISNSPMAMSDRHRRFFNNENHFSIMKKAHASVTKNSLTILQNPRILLVLCVRCQNTDSTPIPTYY